MSMTTTTEHDRRTFDRLMDLEDAVRLSSTAVAFRGAGIPEFAKDRQDAGVASAKARLSAAIDAMTPEQMMAYGQYRIEARA
jgi:hypothetical protein